MQSNFLRCINESTVVAELLSDPSKVVEDDTCLDRILTGLDHIFTNCGYQMSLECQVLSVFEKPTRNVLDNPENYTSSSVGFMLKIHGLYLSQMKTCFKVSWMDRIQFLIRFPPENGFVDGHWFTSSVQSAWIESIKYLILKPSILSEIAHCLQVNNIIFLMDSSSIFVRQLACQCIAELMLNVKKLSMQVKSIEKRNRFDHIVTDINKDHLIKSSVANYIAVLTKMLDSNYIVAVDVLKSLNCKCYLDKHTKTLSEVCASGEQWVPHFLYSLFCEKMNEDTFNLFSISSAYDFALSATERNPSSPVGWRMLTSILLHIPSTYTDVESMKEILLCPLFTVLNKDKLTHTHSEQIRSLLNQRAKLSSALCNSLKGISDLWKHNKLDFMPCQILQLIGLISSDKPYISPHLAENWKAGVTALQLITDNFQHFNTSELKVKLQDGILKFLEHRNADCRIAGACVIVVLKIFQSSDYHDSSLEFLGKILALFCRKLLDRRWQVRDTALEFYTQILSVCNSCSGDRCGECTKNMFLENDIQKETLLHGKDPNSYVRASALQLLKQMMLRTGFCDRDEVVSLVIDVLNNDREAFPRRAAVETLLIILKTSDDNLINSVIDNLMPDFHDDNKCADLKYNVSEQTSISQLVSTVVNKILFQDLDWEVKWNALDILDLFIEFLDNHTRCPSATKYKQQRKCVVSMMEKMVLDCDKAVRDKAAQFLLKRNIASDTISQNSKACDSVISSEQKDQTISDLHALLEGVLLYLQREKQVKLSHGCHGPSLLVHETDESDSYDDSVILDCY